MADGMALEGPGPTLPAYARIPINRCNLPPVILGSLTYQRLPLPLEIDGVRRSHRELVERLERLPDARDRARQFADYMDVHFLLKRREDVGWTPGIRRDRSKADYRKAVRGWMFSPDGLEAAVLKGWVESRFGLVPRYHAGPIRSVVDESYMAYREAWGAGVYNTNALEAQLDLLYTYGQFELARTCGGRTHLRLYRGVRRLDEHEVLSADGRKRTVILNNLSSFTAVRSRADEFGDCILSADVPLPKIAFYSELLPDMLHGEDEFAVLGGVYEVQIET
jgi:NAD+--dinitrogen-reductase ADP-D-ribosyltransferase